MYEFKPIIITGMCKCGHSWEDHHLGVIVNADVIQSIRSKYQDHPLFIPQECEYYGCNEMGGYDTDGNDHCHGYEDKVAGMKLVNEYRIDYSDWDDLVTCGKVYRDENGNNIFHPPVNLHPGQRLKLTPVYIYAEK
jgi:hypothetical protein